MKSINAGTCCNVGALDPGMFFGASAGPGAGRRYSRKPERRQPRAKFIPSLKSRMACFTPRPAVRWPPVAITRLSSMTATSSL